MKKILILFFIFNIFCINSSFAANLLGDRGYYYTDTTEPVSARIVKNNDNTKVGKAEALDILGLVTTGDAGVQKACRNADIKKIDRIEQKSLSIYVFFQKITTMCYGQ